MTTAPPAEVARRLLDLAESREPTLGAGRLICIDGPGGSGKTTLADAVAELAPGSRVVHMDDLYDGWAGLSTSADRLAGLLGPLSEGRSGTYRRYDWHAAEWAETVSVEPSPLLVVEGVGSGAVRFVALVTVLAWVWVPAELRLARGLARDGEHLREQWAAWMSAEDGHFARESTAGRADVVVDGTGGVAPT